MTITAAEAMTADLPPALLEILEGLQDQIDDLTASTASQRLLIQRQQKVIDEMQAQVANLEAIASMAAYLETSSPMSNRER